MSIFRSFFCIQVVYCCVCCSTLGVVAVVLRSRCVVLCTVCEHPTTCSNKQPVYKNSWRWTYRCPKHVEATYDNKSQSLHQVGTSRHFHIWCTVTHTSNIISIHQIQSKSLNSAKCLPQSLSASYSFVNSVSSYTLDVLRHCQVHFRSVAINGHAAAAFFQQRHSHSSWTAVDIMYK